MPADKIRFSFVLFFCFLLLSACGGLRGKTIPPKQTDNPCIKGRVFLTRALPRFQDCLDDVNLKKPLLRYRMVPEYEPTTAVLVSENLHKHHGDKNLISTLLKADIPVWLLSAQTQDFERYRDNLELGSEKDKLKYLTPLHVQTISAWTRDWAPLFAARTLGRRQELKLVDPYYQRSDADVSKDDAVPAQLKFELKQQHLLPAQIEIQKSELPLILEGGNLLCNDHLCFVSAKVAEQNPQGMNAIYADFKRRFSQRLLMVPKMPKEPNGHMDLWAKFLSDDLLLIAEILPETLALVPSESRDFYLQLQGFLNQQATGRDSTGKTLPDTLATQLKTWDPDVKIKRIPLPLPMVLNEISFFRSYVNSLLINGKAILPRFERLFLDDGVHDYPDADLLANYELQVEALYREAGFQPIWANADHVVTYGGTWHCLAAQVPRL